MEDLREVGINMLWEQFINHIKDDWPKKYVSYGPDMNIVNAPIKFAQTVYADMEAYFKKAHLNIRPVNPLTLHHYFQQHGFPLGIKTGTLDLFSMYLGYKRFSDFTEKNKIHIFNRIENSDTKSTGHKQFIPPEEALKITTLIREAGALEFYLYKSAPHSGEVDKLTEYFTLDGPALQLIRGSLENVIRTGRKLRIPGSFSEIIKVEIVFVSKDRAEVKTEEKWRLLWYNMETNKNNVIYDVLNTQAYYLRKIEGKWKIYHNEYPGKLEPIVD